MQNKFNFAVTGERRKSLVAVMSEVLNTPIKYLGAPGFQYRVGEYEISKTGVVTGAYDLNLFVGLAERGFEPEISPIPEEPAQFKPAAEPLPELEANEPDRLCIEVPNNLTPLQIDNLAAMVAAKEPLLKKVLGAEHLPIRVTEEKLAFPWFALSDTADAPYYVQFIQALCETAKEKKRVIAKNPGEFENPRFAMRVWLVGLGLSGREYKKCRALMMQGLSGDSAWRYTKPEKASTKQKTALAACENEVQGDE